MKSTSVEEVKGQFGSNFAPILQIERWIPRPVDLDEVDKANGAAPPPSMDLDEAVDFGGYGHSEEVIQEGDIPWN